MPADNLERLWLIAESQLDRWLTVACGDLLPYNLGFNPLF
jgi:hypothetical protein